MRHVNTGTRGGRPTVFARRGIVSSGHYLATEIGVHILRRGGNAFDAAAAVGFALALLKPHQNGIAGECPMIVRTADGRVLAISGHGPAPAAATLDFFRRRGIARIPGDGLLGAVVPPAVATWIMLLRRFGTMRLADVLGPSIELARDGFAMYDSLAETIAAHAERIAREWPTSAAVFLPAGRPPQPGERFTNPDWADTFDLLLQAESGHADRDAGLAAAAEVFYRGPIARRICQFARGTPVLDATGKANTGLLELDDFAAYAPTIEAAVSTVYRGWRVCKCPPWTQGPAMLATLNLLEPFDLAAMGHNSPDAIHTVVEAMKLAYADREFYYGDPAGQPAGFDERFAELMSKPYADRRRELIDPAAASAQIRPGGRDPLTARGVRDIIAACQPGEPGAPPADQAGPCGDTTKLEVIDSAGNVVSATVSGGWLFSSPVIPGMGFPLGTRGQMFTLAEGHPNCVAPGRRPRSTLTPGVAIFEGDDERFARGTTLAFGSPGGDYQDQWALQFFLNVVVFGQSLQQAVESPTFWTDHWPNSFWPRNCVPASLRCEGRIDPAVRDALARRGHDLAVRGDWAGGNTLAAMADPRSGLLSAAASPRLDPSYAMGF